LLNNLNFLHPGSSSRRSRYKRTIHPSNENMRQFKHEILFLSRFLYVLCTLLDPDPDPNPSLFLPVSLLIRLKRRWLRLGHLSTSVLHRGILHPDPLFICTDPNTDKAFSLKVGYLVFTWWVSWWAWHHRACHLVDGGLASLFRTDRSLSAKAQETARPT
jgi:hypothetical protein